MAIAPLNNDEPIFNEDGTVTIEFSTWVELVSNLCPLTGSGSPEGVVEASNNPPRQYMDTAGAAGSILYVKRDSDIAGDRKKGWILV